MDVCILPTYVCMYSCLPSLDRGKLVEAFEGHMEIAYIHVILATRCYKQKIVQAIHMIY